MFKQGGPPVDGDSEPDGVNSRPSPAPSPAPQRKIEPAVHGPVAQARNSVPHRASLLILGSR